MALNKLKFNSLNVTPTAGKTVGFNSDADGLEATFSGGAMTFISKSTASSSSTINFTSGIDSTYKEYIFVFKDIHPATDNVNFTFNMSIDGGSNYNVTKTTSVFYATHLENDGGQELAYLTQRDLAQSTSDQQISSELGNGSDECTSGYLQIFNPSSSVFVKHFLSSLSDNTFHERCSRWDVAGYGNTTSAVDAVQFKMSSGNIDAGTITLYGIN